MKKIFYCHRGALGDFVLIMFGLRMLRKKFSDAYFIGIGRPEYLRLAARFSLCDKILNCESAVFTDFFSGKRIPQEIQKHDYAVLWLNDGAKVASLLRSEGAKVLLIEPFTGSGHVGIRYFSAISEFFFCRNENINDYLITNDKEETAKIAMIHPGSGSDKKNLSPPFYLSLAKKVESYGFDTKFLFGPIEVEKGLNKAFPCEKSIYPENCLSLKDYISKAAIYIGNDSGPTHLAAFCGIPTFAIFARSDYSVWHPIGACVEYANALNDKLFEYKFDLFLNRVISRMR